jgi:ArsR family transcriptional regulator
VNLLFKALQDETRRRILEMLRERDLSASEISSAFSMSAPSISYHLDLLKHAELVSSRKRGQFVIYSLETTVFDESLGWILNLVKKGRSHANKPNKTKLAGNRPAHRAVHLPLGDVG